MNLRDLHIDYDQDLIKKVSFKKGQNERPLWKVIEVQNPNHMSVWVGRADSLCPLANEWALVQALESAANVAISQRMQFVRTVFSEINRLVYLSTYLGHLVKAVGLDYLYERMMILRELVFQTQEELMGGRILPQVLKLGGARRNLSIGDIQKVGQFIQTWRNGWLQWRSLVDNDDIFESRLAELLTLSPQFVRDHGVWGICGKASGLTYDSRIHQPHGAYTYLNLNFKFNFELRGDALARFYVAEKEVDWTLDILEESIRKIPEEGVVEGPTQNVELNFNPGFYSATAESAKGPVTALVRISKAGQVQNVRVFSPGQRVWPQIENLFIGQKSEDFILGWASLGYSGEEAEI